MLVDDLAGSEVLALCPPSAGRSRRQTEAAGYAAGFLSKSCWCARALTGYRVVRLKGGDVFAILAGGNRCMLEAAGVRSKLFLA